MSSKRASKDAIFNTPILPEKEHSFGETFAAADELSFGDAFSAKWVKSRAAEELGEESDVILTPEEANRRHPNVEKSFIRNVGARKAQYLEDLAIEKKQKQLFISQGSSTAALLGGLWGGLRDPLEFAAGAGIGAALSLGIKARLAKRGVDQALAVKAAQKLTGKLPFQIAENVAGNTLIEVGFSRAESAQLKQEYTLGEAVNNALVGGIGGTLAIKGLAKGLSVGTKVGLEGVSKVRDAVSFDYLGNLEPNQVARIFDAIDLSLQHGKNPNFIKPGDVYMEYASKYSLNELQKVRAEMKKAEVEGKPYVDPESGQELDATKSIAAIDEKLRKGVDEAPTEGEAREAFHARERDIDYHPDVEERIKNAEAGIQTDPEAIKKINATREEADKLDFDEAEKVEIKQELDQIEKKVVVGNDIRDLAKKCILRLGV
jgi:hypothetical protein